MPNNVNIISITDEQAEALLQKFLDAGKLALITSEEAKGGDPDLKVPAHWVIHTVTELEQNRRGHWVARTAEGDFCESYDGPQALLVRCLEAEFGRDVVHSKAAAVTGIIAALMEGREPG